MRGFRFALLLVLATALAMPEVVSAERGRSIRHHSHAPRLGVHIGVPLYWNVPWPYYGYAVPYPAYPPYYPYPPYYAYPPVPRERADPPVYIEREDRHDEGETDERAAGQGYWYYCDRPAGYYPDVRQCPGGWERVAPRPSR